MPVKRLDEGGAQVERKMWRYWCHHGENVCPHSYRFLNHGDGTCTCAFFSGSWKRDAEYDAPDIESDAGEIDFEATQKSQDGVPFDPRVYCANKLQGRCQGEATGLWNQQAGRCFCGLGKSTVGLVTRDTGDTDFEMTENSEERLPYDPSFYCVNTLKGRCPAGTFGIWNERSSSCFCGRGKMNMDLATRDTDSDLETDSNHDLGFDASQKSESRNPFDIHVYCANWLKRQCPAGTSGHFNSRARICFCGRGKMNMDIATRDTDTTPPSPLPPHCGPARNGTSNVTMSTAGPTTADTITSRLMPFPLKFPTGIISNDWTAIEGILVLLDGRLKTQTDLHQVCTGEKDPMVYGFKLDVFRKLCTPEITMPVATAEVVKTEKKVYSALWIDTVLARYNNDFSRACKDAKRPGQIPPSLDEKFILSQLCNMGH